VQKLVDVDVGRPALAHFCVLVPPLAVAWIIWLLNPDPEPGRLFSNNSQQEEVQKGDYKALRTNLLPISHVILLFPRSSSHIARRTLKLRSWNSAPFGKSEDQTSLFRALRTPAVRDLAFRQAPPVMRGGGL